MDFPHHFLFHATDRGARIRGFAGEVAKYECIFTKFRGYEAGHCGGVHGVEGIWIEMLWYETVLFNQVGNHIPLASITDRAGHQRLNQPPIQVFVGRVKYLFQEPVGFFQFVPEEQVGLAKFEFL